MQSRAETLPISDWVYPKSNKMATRDHLNMLSTGKRTLLYISDHNIEAKQKEIIPQILNCHFPPAVLTHVVYQITGLRRMGHGFRFLLPPFLY